MVPLKHKGTWRLSRSVRVNPNLHRRRCHKGINTNTKVKTPTTCTAPDAFNSLKAPGVSAPGAPQAQEGFTKQVNLSGGNPISQSVSTPMMTIVNTTLPGHVFYPGTVTWQVSPAGTGSTIDVTGTGTGAHPAFNDLVGELFFGLMSYLVQTGCDAANGIPNGG